MIFPINYNVGTGSFLSHIRLITTQSPETASWLCISDLFFMLRRLVAAGTATGTKLTLLLFFHSSFRFKIAFNSSTFSPRTSMLLLASAFLISASNRKYPVRQTGQKTPVASLCE